MASRAAGRLSQPGDGTNLTLLLSALNKKSMYDFYGVVIAGMGRTAGEEAAVAGPQPVEALDDQRAAFPEVGDLCLGGRNTERLEQLKGLIFSTLMEGSMPSRL